MCPGPIKAGVPTVPDYEEPGSGKGAEDGKAPVEATRKSKRARGDEVEEVGSAQICLRSGSWTVVWLSSFRLMLRLCNRRRKRQRPHPSSCA